ncbi:MAG TPA: tetratricopeptide repeat protein [Pirellulales bacterium]|nr:tetratricopeptide repeat protein [Pirellulales bacterium]
MPRCRIALIAATLLLTTGGVRAADFDQAVEAYRVGKYEEALAAAEEATAEPFGEMRWWHLRLECLATLGRRREGVEAIQLAQRHNTSDAGLYVLGATLLRNAGKPAEARKLLEELLRTAANNPWRYQTADDRVWLGRAAARLGNDAREVLEHFYDEARRLDPELREVYAATGDLALEKHDDRVAAETFRAAVEKFPNDPDLLCGLAQSLGNEASTEAAELLNDALAINPRHVPSLLAVAEEALEHEAFVDARAALDTVHGVDPKHPRAWALRAVLAHLQADDKAEAECRKQALAAWKKNPDVDYVIGTQLSKAYRFAEGAAHQRQALKLERDYLPARTQLAQDLLRLGENDEGWKLIDEVQRDDEYNVVAYNLANLHERIVSYATLESEHFRVLMDRRESQVYGPRVLELLEQACATLGKKYDWYPKKRVTVEILTSQKDFAVRTFGLPGGDGILGVCFGQVITLNSPAALPGSPTNWQATVWHEYCHVVTLELTKHRIPRWLSEGISVYEERQANRTWGNRLNRDTRRMILADELTPISKLNEAFRRPSSAAHFNLAYYEASLAVEFLVEQFGHATLRDLLADVAKGLPVNVSLERRTGSLDGFEQSFDEYARQTAARYGFDIDWSDEPTPPATDTGSAAIAEWLSEHPRHLLARLRLAQALLAERKPSEAVPVLEALVADVPEWSGDDSPYALLAKAHREQGDTAAERRVLEELAVRSDDALAAYRRLIELAAAEHDALAVAKNFDRYVAVQPLDELPYRVLANGALNDDESDAAAPVAAAKALVALEPADKSGAHFLLARLLHRHGDPEAKRQVLMALEAAPRFRAAQRLLLQIVDSEDQP